jgi:hypothetical protein
MTKQQAIVLGAMAAGKDATYSPVQIQKLLFLVDKRLSRHTGGPHFNFQPYHYGPFDSAVFAVLDSLETRGFVHIDRNPDQRCRSYRLTPTGQTKGQQILDSLNKPVAEYITRLSKFVRAQTFAQLVSAIYKAYPETRVNSVFQGA